MLNSLPDPNLKGISLLLGHKILKLKGKKGNKEQNNRNNGMVKRKIREFN